MLFKKWSEFLSLKLCHTAGDSDNYHIAMVKYWFETAFSGLLSLAILTLLGLSLGIFQTVLMIAITGAVIKNFTGGLHMNTPLRCAVYGGIQTIIVAYLAILFPLVIIPLPVTIIILFALNTIVWLKAPQEHAAKPLTTRQKPLLALCSRFIIFIISFSCLLWPQSWGINELFYGAVFQILTLTKPSSRLNDSIDFLLAKIERKPLF